MSDVILKKEDLNSGKTVQVIYDMYPESPREWDNLGTMLTWTSRYSSPDDNPFKTPMDFSAAISDDKYIILPVYKYEHGQVAYSTVSFVGRAHHAEWDSGQVGWIYVSKAKVRREYGWHRITQSRQEFIKNLLKGEVEDYSCYANGAVYAYQIVDIFGDVLDFCGGFYDMDECLEEGKGAAVYA